MNISFLRITIEPKPSPFHGFNEKRFTTEIIADGTRHTVELHIRNDDFESLFDILMDDCKKMIKEHVKKKMGD